MLVIQQLPDGKITVAIELIWNCFLEFVAPDYSSEGVRAFKNYIYDKEQINKLKFFVAFDANELVGVLAADFKTHNICLFFVKNKYHKQGIGKALFNNFLLKTDANRIMVNSSPYAVGFYHRLGFKDITSEKVSDGIRFIPMEYLR